MVDLSWMDGLMLGDGCISGGKATGLPGNSCVKLKSTSCQWTEYGLSPWGVSARKRVYKDGYSPGSCYWEGWSPRHAEFTEQRRRWYPNRVKCVPSDVRLDCISCMLWFLGDGGLYIRRGQVAISLATTGFDPDSRALLKTRLGSMRIDVQINTQGNLVFSSNSVWRWFKLIGVTSPVPDYAYKFDIPECRRYPRTAEVARAIGISRALLSYFVQSWNIPVIRSAKGGYVGWPEEAFSKFASMYILRQSGKSMLKDKATQFLGDIKDAFELADVEIHEGKD